VLGSLLFIGSVRKFVVQLIPKSMVFYNYARTKLFNC